MKFFLLYLLLISSAFGEEVQSFSLKIKSPKGEFSEQMKVTINKDGYNIVYTDRTGESSRNVFNNHLDPLETNYYNNQNQNYMKLIFDMVNRKIISSGKIEKSYKLEEPVYDGNGSMFFIFSKILPDPDNAFYFNMLQSKDKRIVKMKFAYSGREMINIGGIRKNCLKYEMKLAGRVLSFFWPYSYYYWFDEESKKFLRYEGPAGNENNEVIEVVN